MFTRKKSLAAVVSAVAILVGSQANAVPLQISMVDNPRPFDDQRVGEIVAASIEQFVNSANLPPSLLLTNLASVKVTQNSAAPGGYPQFGTDTLQIQVPVEDYRYLFVHWGTAEEGLGLLWYLDQESGFFSMESPTGDFLTSYTLYGAKKSSAVPDSAPSALLLGIGCCVVGGVWRKSRGVLSRS
jgi:hypothetical protein